VLGGLFTSVKHYSEINTMLYKVIGRLYENEHLY
jgi:hypothetical protein